MDYCYQNVTTGAVDNWQSNPISGESPITSQKHAWSNDFVDVMTVLRDYHFSFLGPAGGHEWDGNQTLLHEMKRTLGYNLHIANCSWPDTIRLGESFNVSLVMTNSGAAPCCHSFPVELALCASDGTPVWTNRLAVDLSEVRPGMVYTNIESVTVDCVPAGDWSVRVGVIDPRWGRPGVRLQNVGEDANVRYELGTISVAPHPPSVAVMANHLDMDIAGLTEAEVQRAKQRLHIAYGHTSHGSQVTDGMSGLVGFANGGGKGMTLPADIFAWDNGGSGGALDLHDEAMGGDVGYYPQWYNNTQNYLDNAAHTDVNVIVWSWCGQMPGKYDSGTLTNEYLLPMSMLETNYPGVVFVYMTGHVDIWADDNQKAACKAIRDYCAANNKVLYDFSDIECYDPDGVFYEYVHDSCDYYTEPGSGVQGNWATAWQATHTEDVDWYACSAAHSQALNANQKAYAAWSLWCKLAADLDRDGISDAWEETHGGVHCFAGGTHDYDGDTVPDAHEFAADTNPTNAASLFEIVSVSNATAMAFHFASSSNRTYGLQGCNSLATGSWVHVAGATNHHGTGGEDELRDTNDPPMGPFYRLRATR